LKLNHLDVPMNFDPAYEIMFISLIFIIFCAALLFSTMTASFHFMTIVLVMVGIVLLHFKYKTRFVITDQQFKWHYFKRARTGSVDIQSIESIQFSKNKMTIKTKKKFKYELYFYSKYKDKIQTYIENHLSTIQLFEEDTNKTF